MIDALRAAVAEGRSPGPEVRAALLESADPAFMRRAGKVLASPSLEPRTFKVAILSTCTIGSYEPLLRASLAGVGVAAGFEHHERELEMALATGRLQGPDLATVLADESFFLPEEWDPADVEHVVEHLEARMADFRRLVARSEVPLVVHTVPLPGEVRDAFISLRGRARITRAWYELNAAILGLAEDLDQVTAVDLVGLLADRPVQARDDRLHRYGDMPYTDGALLLLAQQVRRVVQARTGASRKVLALDLDNTLWGGVIGEVGAGGVQLGGLYPGNSYLALQRAVRRLRGQGVILVLASKNDADLVEETLTDHPSVLLRPPDFSVRMVNWSSKSENLRRAVEILNLSASSLVFMDDSDFERGLVAAELPEVAVVSAAGDPAYLVRHLLELGLFDVMSLTAADRQRADLYRTRAERVEFSDEFAAPEDYLRALDISLEIAEVSDYTVGRAAQLAARTNQFNLTGVRFDEATTAAMAADPGQLVVVCSVADRFGDEGIVGAAWVAREEDAWRVLNMVLSCRVFGRGIEFAIASWLAEQAFKAGASRVEGRFVPAKRNGVAANFWKEAGFSLQPDGEYALPVGAAVDRPAWITLREGA